MKEVFKVGDRVYSGQYQRWGVVTDIYPKIVDTIRVEWDEPIYNEDIDDGSPYIKADLFSTDGRPSPYRAKDLSFTYYDYINGGFSQERNENTNTIKHLIMLDVIEAVSKINSEQIESITINTIYEPREASLEYDTLGEGIMTKLHKAILNALKND